MSAILFVDPGTRQLGWARFICDGKNAWYSRSATIAAPRKEKWIKRIDYMVRELVIAIGNRKQNERFPVQKILIEMPRRFFSDRGNAAANTGSILKVMAVAFSLRQCLLERGYEVRMLRVESWKGQVKKWVTARRVEKHWGVEVSEDERAVGSDRCDACGMGDWYFRKPKGWGYGVKVVKRD